MRNKEWEEEKKEEESSRGRGGGGAKMEGCAVLLTEGECVRERGRQQETVLPSNQQPDCKETELRRRKERESVFKRDGKRVCVLKELERKCVCVCLKRERKRVCVL